MSFLARLFLESPLWLGLFCFAVLGIVLFARQRMESETARRRALLAILFGIPLLFIVQSLVVTQRERILERFHRFVAAIEDDDANVAMQFVSPTFNSEGAYRDEFARQLDSWLDWLDIRDVRLRRRDIDVDDDAAAMKLTATATVQMDGGAGEEHIGAWIIEWKREGGEWFISAIRPQMVDFRPIGSMTELRRAAGGR